MTDISAVDVPVYIRSIRVLGSQPQDIIGSSNTTSTNDDKQWNQLQCMQNQECLVAVHVRRHGGLMVSALVFGASGPGSSSGRDIVLCSWARHFTLTVPLSTQVYKWVTVNSMLGVTL